MKNKVFISMLLVCALILSVAAFVSADSSEALALGDVDKDGKIEADDALQVLQYSVGKIDKFTEHKSGGNSSPPETIGADSCEEFYQKVAKYPDILKRYTVGNKIELAKAVPTVDDYYTYTRYSTTSKATSSTFNITFEERSSGNSAYVYFRKLNEGETLEKAFNSITYKKYDDYYVSKDIAQGAKVNYYTTKKIGGRDVIVGEYISDIVSGADAFFIQGSYLVEFVYRERNVAKSLTDTAFEKFSFKTVYFNK